MDIQYWRSGQCLFLVLEYCEDKIIQAEAKRHILWLNLFLAYFVSNKIYDWAGKRVYRKLWQQDEAAVEALLKAIEEFDLYGDYSFRPWIIRSMFANLAASTVKNLSRRDRKKQRKKN